MTLSPNKKGRPELSAPIRRSHRLTISVTEDEWERARQMAYPLGIGTWAYLMFKQMLDETDRKERDR